MNLVFTVLCAFTIGWLVRQRTTAVALYLACSALVVSYQTLGLLLGYLAGEHSEVSSTAGAFGPVQSEFPITYTHSELLAYGSANLAIVLVGVGLVLLGSRLRARRAERTAVAAERAVGAGGAAAPGDVPAEP